MLTNLAYEVVMASRGPQIALAATLALSGFVLLPGGKRKGVWLVLVVLAAAAVIINVGRINPRFTDRRALHTFVDRDKVWQHTWHVLVPQRPLLGYGHGRAVFDQAYYGSNPPPSPFHFAHAHSYWLYVLFSYGAVGLALHAAGWTLLAGRLAKHIRRQRAPEDRLLPGLVLLLILHIHVYGLADWPASVVGVMLIWLIPAALVVTAEETSCVRQP